MGLWCSTSGATMRNYAPGLWSLRSCLSLTLSRNTTSSWREGAPAMLPSDKQPHDALPSKRSPLAEATRSAGLKKRAPRQTVRRRAPNAMRRTARTMAVAASPCTRKLRSGSSRSSAWRLSRAVRALLELVSGGEPGGSPRRAAGSHGRVAGLAVPALHRPVHRGVPVERLPQRGDLDVGRSTGRFQLVSMTLRISELSGS
mmetsp:Transcript_30891/g.65719  ORF Transcript_30891/g.65719 Transcript_30891/m.65719 type:complete len:201 (-) Transcript_30891:402-1004(-)